MAWFVHVVRMEDKRLPAKALYCYVDEKRSRRKQTKTWMKNGRQDLAEKGLENSPGYDERQREVETSCKSSSLVNT